MMFPKPERVKDRKLLAKVRKQECSVCWERPGNRSNPIEVSHIATRGAGNPDTDWNCVPMCRQCHIKWGRLGAQEFINRFPNFWPVLAKRGWVFVVGRLRHPRQSTNAKFTKEVP